MKLKTRKNRAYLIETSPSNVGLNKQYPMALEGIFFKCYNDTAKIVSDAMGYKLNKSDNILMVGFPKTSLSNVLDVLDKKYSGILEKHVVDEDLVYYTQIQGTNLSIPNVEATSYLFDKTLPEEVFSELIKINLNEITPMKAMQLLGSMKNKCVEYLNY